WLFEPGCQTRNTPVLEPVGQSGVGGNGKIPEFPARLDPVSIVLFADESLEIPTRSRANVEDPAAGRKSDVEVLGNSASGLLIALEQRFGILFVVAEGCAVHRRDCTRSEIMW